MLKRGIEKRLDQHAFKNELNKCLNTYNILKNKRRIEVKMHLQMLSSFEKYKKKN